MNMATLALCLAFSISVHNMCLCQESVVYERMNVTYCSLL
jgi:hypothetical protein